MERFIESQITSAIPISKHHVFWAAHPAALFIEYQSVIKKDGIIDTILFNYYLAISLMNNFFANLY